MSRSAWKGDLKIGPISVPVRLFNAGESPDKVSFNQAHRCSAETLTRAQTKRWCERCDIEIETLARVFESAAGQYLEVTDADLATCEPSSSSTFELQQLLYTSVNPLFIDTTALLVPDGPAAAEPFETIRRLFENLGATAIGHLVYQKRHVRVAIQASEFGFAAFFLRTAKQVQVLVSNRPDVTFAAPVLANIRRLQHAMRDSLEHGPFNYSTLRDHYGEGVQKMLAAKIAKQVKADLKASLTPKKKARKRA